MNRTVRLPAGFRLVALDQATSTNEVALQRVAAGDARDGDVVWALRQSAGRGRHGRAWQSPQGNLFATFVIRHAGELATAAQLSFVAALAVHRAVTGLVAHPETPAIACKWPNDVLIGGSKVAGILLEVAEAPHDDARFIVVGIGINLAHAPERTDYPATSVEDALGRIIEPGPMLQSLAEHFDSARKAWRERGFGDIRRDWLAIAHGVGDAITVRTGDRTLQGRYAGLDEDGALLLDTGDGNLAIGAGDVHFPAIPNTA